MTNDPPPLLKLAKKLKADAHGNSVAREYPYADWSGSSLHGRPAQYIILSNTKTLYILRDVWCGKVERRFVHQLA